MASLNKIAKKFNNYLMIKNSQHFVVGPDGKIHVKTMDEKFKTEKQLADMGLYKKYPVILDHPKAPGEVGKPRPFKGFTGREPGTGYAEPTKPEPAKPIDEPAPSQPKVGPKSEPRGYKVRLVADKNNPYAKTWLVDREKWSKIPDNKKSKYVIVGNY